MLATVPAYSALRAAYIQELETTTAQWRSIGALPALPWALLALNATFYLDQYLTKTAYRSALAEAIHRSTSERQTFSTLSWSSPADDELQALIETGAPRAALYRWLFDHALRLGDPARFLLAQHACEIAEVVAEAQLLPALRLGLIELPETAFRPAVAPTSTVVPGPHTIEDLSRALLRYRIPARSFAESLLLLHAAQRARQLTGVVYPAPSKPAEQSDAAAPNPACAPKRLRIVQRHDLAERAVNSGDPLAILTVEAGLVEAEDLRGAPQLLLLSALDRALTSLI